MPYSNKRQNISVDVLLGDTSITLQGTFYKGREGTFYSRNGDPGDPPEPPEFYVEQVKISEEDVTEAFANLYIPEIDTQGRVKYIGVVDALVDRNWDMICERGEGNE